MENLDAVELIKQAMAKKAQEEQIKQAMVQEELIKQAMLKIAAVDEALANAVREHLAADPEAQAAIAQAIEEAAEKEGREPDEVAEETVENMKAGFASIFHTVLRKMAEAGVADMLAAEGGNEEEKKEEKKEKEETEKGAAAVTLAQYLGLL